MPNSFGLSSRPLASLLFSALLVALAAVPAAAQDVPADGLLLRLQANALETAEVPPELAALETNLQRPTPYTAAVIHPHNGRMSVTISQGTLQEGDAPSRFLNDEAAEFFFYDRVLDENERGALRNYLAAHYNTSQAEGSDGLNQGVHVQGSWSIEVRDPDGSLTERRSFENELINPRLLSRLVVGESVVGGPMVEIDGSPRPCGPDGDETLCLSVTPAGGAVEGFRFETLEVEVPSEGDNENAVVLNGSVTVQRDADIDNVGVSLGLCETDTAPDNCTGFPFEIPLTSRTLQENSVSVTEGQQVNVTVVISFN